MLLITLIFKSIILILYYNKGSQLRLSQELNEKLKLDVKKQKYKTKYNGERDYCISS